MCTLTGSDDDVPADDGANGVGGDAAVDGGVHVLSVDLGLERRKVERAVAQGHADPRDKGEQRAVARHPLDQGVGVALGQAVDAAAVAVGELETCRWLNHKARPLRLKQAVHSHR